MRYTLDWSDLSTIARFLDDHPDWSPMLDAEGKVTGIQSPPPHEEFGHLHDFLMPKITWKEDEDGA